MKIIAAVILSAGLFAASAMTANAQTSNQPIPGIDVVVQRQCPPDCPKPAKQSAAPNNKPKKPVAQNTAGNGIGGTDVGLDDMDGKRKASKKWTPVIPRPPEQK